MSNNFGLFFLFSVLITGLIINPSTFPVSFNNNSNDSDLSLNLMSFAFAKETSVNATETEDKHSDEFYRGVVSSSSETSIETSAEENVTLCHVPPDNQTKSHSITVASQSVSAHLAHGDYLGKCDDEINDEAENIHEQLGMFVKESRTLFKEQKEETRLVIKECQISLIASEPSQRDAVRKQCRDNLDDIKESYKEIRVLYTESFKEFRKIMDIAIRESKGITVNDSEKIIALSDIESSLKSGDDVEKIKELRNSISDTLKEDKKQLREDKKEERKQMREGQKQDRDTMKEQNKEDRDTIKENNQEERENGTP